MRKVLWIKCFAKFFIQINNHMENVPLVFYLIPDSRPSKKKSK